MCQGDRYINIMYLDKKLMDADLLYRGDNGDVPFWGDNGDVPFCHTTDRSKEI